MEDDLMFTMEEEEGSAKRPPVQRRAPNQRACSLSDANASDDDDEENFISPILSDSTKEICDYLKNLVYNRQLSNSLPKSNFVYKVSVWPGNIMQRESTILPVYGQRRGKWKQMLKWGAFKSV